MSDVTASGEILSQPAQGYNVPGRKPGSQMPWDFFMGNASHCLIAFKYGIDRPDSVAYYNNKSLKIIIRETGLGDVSLLLPDEREICPDITDVSRLALFEIKPWNERALQEGREEARKYLAALNRTLLARICHTGHGHSTGVAA